MAMREPIFILGPHKSGTSLLRSLLDGSSNLFAVPFEMHFFQHANEWVDYRLRRSRPPVRSIDMTKDAYIRHVEKVNRSGGKMGDSDLKNLFDLNIFRDLMATEVSSFKELIALYIQASYFSLTGKNMPANLRVVEKSVENAEFAMKLKGLFPSSKFVHIIRNPYSNLVSLRRYLKRGGRSYPFLGPALKSLENNYYWLHHNQKLLNDSYFVVRYEDLLQNPENTMKNIAAFLDLEFDSSLLNPTSMGTSWEGNSSRGLKFSGISTKNLNLWKREINHLECHLVNRLFPFILREYKYDLMKPNRRFLWPTSGERPKSYLLNRLISYFY